MVPRGSFINFKPVEWFETATGCWECTSHCVDRDGYPEIFRYGLYRKAHRWMYEECFGEVPNGVVVRHKCDNPLCINPEHLTIGTPKANVHDSIIRNRFHRKLSWVEVQEIRRSKERGIDLAKRFQVSPALVCKIRKEVCWDEDLHNSLEGGENRFNRLAKKEGKK